MKLKIKKANKFYLVENDAASTDSSVGTSNNDDIFTIKDTDSEFLQNFKEYCKSAVNNTEQPTGEDKPENASTPSDNTPGEGKQGAVGDAAEKMREKASDVAGQEVLDSSTGN